MPKSEPVVPEPLLTTAGKLCVDHIGLQIRFLTIDEVRHIHTVITAELRQIHHNGNDTSIQYGEMAEREVTLSHDHHVVLHPAYDFSDRQWFSGGVFDSVDHSL